MRLYLLKDECLEDLKIKVKNNSNKYLQNNMPWLDEYFSKESYRIPLNIEINAPKLIKPSEGKNNDLENSIALFESLRNLIPVLATEELFWSYLCHTTYYNYIQARWPLKKEGISSIKLRYFFEGGRARGVARNGLSRLWWASYMTYDRNRSDPYELTRLLLNNQDEFESIIDRSLTRNKNVLFALLIVLAETEHKREDFRALMRKLNRIGGVTVLSVLSIDELKHFISKCLNEVIEENKELSNNKLNEKVSLFEKIVTQLKGKRDSA